MYWVNRFVKSGVVVGMVVGLFKKVRNEMNNEDLFCFTLILVAINVALC